jgi:nuclear transport factor 2 (NTF2) superfamily protein
VTTLPHNFKRIRLDLARSKEFPLGSTRHGYEFVAPLNANWHIDVEQWKKDRAHCRVRRFWEGEEDRIGQLMHDAHRPEGGRWFFDYDPDDTADDERGYRFGVHAFRPGEYVSIRDQDGEMHTFQVSSVEAAT